MNKKEIIEDMCKNFKCCVACEMFNGFINDNDELENCSCAEHSDRYCTQCYISTNQAKTLYNAGYRKIPEGSVVLSKEENDINNKFIKYLQRRIDELNEYSCNVYKQARKETAIKIAFDIESRLAYYKDEDTFTKTEILLEIKEILKENGVEV